MTQQHSYDRTAITSSGISSTIINDGGEGCCESDGRLKSGDATLERDLLGQSAEQHWVSFQSLHSVVTAPPPRVGKDGSLSSSRRIVPYFFHLQFRSSLRHHLLLKRTSAVGTRSNCSRKH